jgi:hypothetical protein
LNTLDELKEITKKSETQIIAEALEIYRKYVNNNQELETNLQLFLDKIAELSYKLGKCEEKLAHIGKH